MEAKFKGLFTGKTEKFFFVTMCKSCFNEGMRDVPIKEGVSHKDHFELVQMSEKG